MPRRLTTGILVTLFATLFAVAQDTDPYLWLEEIEGEKALAWAKQQSAATTAELEAVPEFAELHEKLLEIFTSRDIIVVPDGGTNFK